MSEMSVEATLENLDAVTGFVNRQLEACGCNAGVLMKVDLIVEEIYVNIAQYAYRPGTGPVEVRCDVSEDPLQVVIEFLDAGQPYNPLAKADPEVDLPAAERDIGGLGVFMVKKLVDGIHYAFRDGKNILTIEKRF